MTQTPRGMDLMRLPGQGTHHVAEIFKILRFSQNPLPQNHDGISRQNTVFAFNRLGLRSSQPNNMGQWRLIG